jgi:hypothetical protein
MSNDHKIGNGKWPQKIPNCHKIYILMAIQYNIIFHFKAFQNIPKLRFYTTWQPWFRDWQLKRTKRSTQWKYRQTKC